MSPLPTGASVPEKFAYPIVSPHGRCVVTGSPAKVLVADSVTHRFAVLGAAAADTLRRPRVRDVGTGSGIFAAALLMHCANPDSLEIAVNDISGDAVQTAQRNIASAARSRNANPRVKFSDSHLVDDDLIDGRLAHILYANLPYLLEHERSRILPVAQMAPTAALFDGSKDGLGLIRELLPLLPRVLAPGSIALVRTPQEWSRLWQVHRIAEEVYGHSAASATPSLLHRVIRQGGLPDKSLKLQLIESAWPTSPSVCAITFSRHWNDSSDERFGAGLVIGMPPDNN